MELEYDDLVKEACAIHMLFAKDVYKVIENFISRGENRVLLWLWQQEQPCAADVIQYFGLSAGRVSNLLKALEKKGFLFREKSAGDRRISYIVLTEEGQEQARRIYEDLHLVFQEFFQIIGEKDARSFLDFEKKIMKLMEEGTLVLTSPGQD